MLLAGEMPLRPARAPLALVVLLASMSFCACTATPPGPWVMSRVADETKAVLSNDDVQPIGRVSGGWAYVGVLGFVHAPLMAALALAAYWAAAHRRRARAEKAFDR